MTKKKAPEKLFAMDFRRISSNRLYRVMIGVSLALPILILVMTTMASGTEDAASGELFTSAWQILGATSDGGMAMDLTTMCNINLIFMLAAAWVCPFVTEDFRSGFIKNVLSIRSKRTSYVFSKIAVCALACALLLPPFFLGALLGGKLAGLSFAFVGFGAANVALCLISKMLLISAFSSIFVFMSVLAQRRTWLAVLLSLFVGMFLFMIIPISAPLDASLLNVLLCLIGGVLFSLGFCWAGGKLLARADIH